MQHYAYQKTNIATYTSFYIIGDYTCTYKIMGEPWPVLAPLVSTTDEEHEAASGAFTDAMSMQFENMTLAMGWA
jgi:hypothetical protein